jgi:hypothetical protein
MPPRCPLRSVFYSTLPGAHAHEYEMLKSYSVPVSGWCLQRKAPAAAAPLRTAVSCCRRLQRAGVGGLWQQRKMPVGAAALPQPAPCSPLFRCRAPGWLDAGDQHAVAGRNGREEWPGGVAGKSGRRKAAGDLGAWHRGYGTRVAPLVRNTSAGEKGFANSRARSSLLWIPVTPPHLPRTHPSDLFLPLR